MSILKGACIIGQSGGPTSVINASALGAIEAALDHPSITRVYGAAYGIRGVLDDVLYVLDEENRAELQHMRYTPSSALGSCRYKLKDPGADDTDYKRILEIFKKYDVRYFFYNGGNDSMDTCNKISKYCLESGYECRVMGIPKTIDNDLFGTDHCPGFASAAKYIATATMEVFQDSRVYDIGMITILEIMGRHAGWLTAASALAGVGGCAPDLIYLPEVPFDMERFHEDVEAVYNKTGKALIAVSEGIQDKDGRFIAEYGVQDGGPKDSFGHSQLGGLESVLTDIVKKRTGAKVRGIEFSLLQRAAAHCASQTDIEESYAAGRAAVENAVAGVTDKMVGCECDRGPDGYRFRIKLLPLDSVANTEKKVPRDWINAAGNGIEQPFIDYALPLIQGETQMTRENGLPRFVRLKKVRA